MSRFVILSVALIALINSSNIPRTTSTPPGISPNDKTFVQTACDSTTYPTLSYSALSSYSSTIKSDPIKLCLTSLSVNLKSAKSVSSILSSLLKKVASSPEVSNILKDCLKEMMYTAYEHKQVIAKIIKGGCLTEREMNKKLETWASSALTDVTTCMNKFKEVKVKTLALITSYLH